MAERKWYNPVRHGAENCIYLALICSFFRQKTKQDSPKTGFLAVSDCPV